MEQNNIDLNITGIANGGEGIGRLPDGRIVFVPFTIPGESVRIRVIESKKGFVRGEVVEILSAVPGRIKPRCRHFGICGGCHLQQMDYRTQLFHKAGIIRDVLSRIGGIKGIDIQPVVPSPFEWEYRNQVQYHLHPSGTLGYQRHSSNETIPIDECFLPVIPLVEMRNNLELDPQTGIKRVTFREGLVDDYMIVLDGNSSDIPEMEIDLPFSVVHQSEAGTITLAGSDFVHMKIKDRIFKVSAGSFFQVNTKMAEMMVDHVLSLIPPGECDCIVDLFCGVGLFSAFVADRAKRLIGVESSLSACSDYAENMDEFDHVELYEGLCDHVLPGLDIDPDVVIVDPPRAGIGKVSMEALIRMNPNRIIYISCDQATLARDASMLVHAGYRIMQLTPFDFFPQTHHIESITLFSKQSE